MKNKPGYKMTPLGWIPEEWTLVKLKAIVSESRLGGNYENAEANLGIPVIKMGNLDRGCIKLDKVQYLPENEEFQKEDVLNFGDLLFNTRNTMELVGKVAIWRNELPLAIYNSNLLRIKFRDDLIYSSFFMNFAFNSRYSLQQLRGVATGTTSVAAIYGRDLDNISFLIPPLPEQKAIAKVLSTWDKAIEKTQELIKQTELRKKYLMQQLLTGKKRLKGFSGEWKEMRLGEFFEERHEVGFNQLPLLSVGANGIYPQTDSSKKDTSNEDKSKYKRIMPGDIGYNTMRMWQGRSALSELEGIISPAYTVIKPREKTDSVFFSYLFKHPRIIYLFYTHSQGLVDDTLNCKYHDLATIKVKAPEVEEQNSIAQVFLKVDFEITLLIRSFETLLLQKKGLMQMLLTGKKRLGNECN